MRLIQNALDLDFMNKFNIFWMQFEQIYMICYFLLSFQLVSYDEGNTKGKTINKKANLFSGSVKGISCLNLVGLPVFEDTCLGVKNGHNL